MGQTNIVTDNLNPVYVTSVLVDYMFEETQELRLTVYHLPDLNPGAKVEQTEIGSVDLFAHDIVRAQGNPLALPLKRYYILFTLL